MKFTILRALIFISFLLTPWDATLAEKANFPATLDNLYSNLSDFIFEHYIMKGYTSIVFLPAESHADYETVISRNCNLALINRLNRLKEHSNDPHIRNVQVTDVLPKDIKNSKAVFLEIEINEVHFKGNDFQIKVFLKERAATNWKVTIRTIEQLQGTDPFLPYYIAEKVKLTPIACVFIVIGILAFASGFILVVRRKRNVRFYRRPIREENLPFLMMAIVSFIMIFLFFITIYLVKRAEITGHAYFEGAEVHFFIDRNSGLFFNAGENNFINLTRKILKETCNKISYKVLHPETPELEKLGDLLTRLINWILDQMGQGRFKIKEFPDLKQSEYTYSVYTFTAEGVKQLTGGNLAELVPDYNSVIAPALKIQPELRESSLIKPLVELYDKLIKNKEGEKKKKKFIIIFTDAAESRTRDVEIFLENVKQFYKQKDQYLRVFSIFFPNIPRISSDIHIYPYEEGKLLLLSKISEFIVYMNGIERYTPERLRAVNNTLFEKLESFISRDSLKEEEAHYSQKLTSFAKLTSKMQHEKLLSIHEIAKQNFLKNFVELEDLQRQVQNPEKSVYSDFFLYTYIDDLYKVDSLDFEGRGKWVNVGDYNEARGRAFGQPLNSLNVKQVVRDISDTFVEQFIIIDKEVDKELFIFKINKWITRLAIAFSLFYAYLLYRYKYHVNSRIENKDYIISIIAPVMILVILVATLIYFRFENRWTIYGDSCLAIIVSAIFLFCYYLLPLLPYFRYRWLLLRGTFTPKLIPLQDTTFDFDEVVWLKWLDRVLFNIIMAPFLAFSLFLQILSPVYKSGISETEDPLLISIMNTIFKKWLDISDYNQVIEYFLVVWVIVTGFYLCRAFIYSKTARVIN